MAAVSEIATLSECLMAVGKQTSATPSELGLAQWVKRVVEASMRRYIGCNVVQTTYTHFVPRGNHPAIMRDFELDTGRGRGRRMFLPEWPVRDSDATGVSADPRVFEDRGGNYGKATGSFPSSSELTYGDDFFFELKTAGLSLFGGMIRDTRDWYWEGGSLKVIYTAGFSAAELDGDVSDPDLDASDIKLAVVESFVEKYNEMLSKRSGQAGAIGTPTSLSLDGYSVTYDTTNAGSQEMLSPEAKKRVGWLRRIKAG